MLVGGLINEAYSFRRNSEQFHLPGRTFWGLKEMRQFGEYRIRRLVLNAWECLNREDPS
jgi:hypothetical protein